MTKDGLAAPRIRLTQRKNGERMAQLYCGSRAVTKKLPLSAFNEQMQRVLQEIAPNQDVRCLPEELPTPATVLPAPRGQQPPRIPVQRINLLPIAAVYLGFAVLAWLLGYHWTNIATALLIGSLLLIIGKVWALSYTEMTCPRCGGSTRWERKLKLSSRNRWLSCRACRYRVFYECAKIGGIG